MRNAECGMMIPQIKWKNAEWRERRITYPCASIKSVVSIFRIPLELALS
jgi:hypothetical protein